MESEFLPLANPFEDRWEELLASISYCPDENEEAMMIFERCLDQCTVSDWVAKRSGSIRRLFSSGMPPFAKVTNHPQPYIDVWHLLQATLGATTTRTTPLPWWMELAYPPQDYFVALTSPPALDALATTLVKLDAIAVAVPILNAIECEDYADDLEALGQFLIQQAGQGNWIVAWEAGS
ncbi:hypothetical protein DO97_16355 [Neosynechococcus sphagnicola sy1]|uniref:DUF4253 domain-containing protein n=1 Tax=Neosynechococcus sphagnicola sy1 TaxID=1497020 RepID=A0A098TI33_9CYAN|nr:hypothetical protein DO97_16355 [Neosynechococcus sphagnicola sy1]